MMGTALFWTVVRHACAGSAAAVEDTSAAEEQRAIRDLVASVHSVMPPPSAEDSFEAIPAQSTPAARSPVSLDGDLVPFKSSDSS